MKSVVDKRVGSKGGDAKTLSPNQRKILRLITEEFETPRSLSSRLGVTRQAIYKTIGKLKKKGYLSWGNLGGVDNRRGYAQGRGLTKVIKNGIRLHSQEFNIDILYKSNRYAKLKKKATDIFIDDNRIRLYNNSIEIYASKDRFFMAEDAHKATSLSLNYWNRIFSRIEDRLQILIVKEGHANIRQVNAHYSEVNNELAREYNEKHKKLRIYAREDGKLAIEVDNSLQLNEFECRHPKTAKRDMGIIHSFFDDLRENNPPTLSQLMVILKEIMETNKETASGLNIITQLLVPQQQLEGKTSSKTSSKEIPSYIN